MNYKKVYEDIMKKARIRKETNTYEEKHHVIPSCMGGKDGEVLNLTLKEHFMAHLLLIKIYPDNASLRSAYILMANTRSQDEAKRIRNSREFERYRRMWIKDLRDGRRAGENNSRWGVIPTKETREKISETLRRNGSLKGEKNPNFGKKFSVEHRENLSKSHKGKPSPFKGMKNRYSQETLDRLSARFKGEKHPFYGKKLSDEHIKNMKAGLKGRKAWNKGKTGIYSEETLQRMRDAAKKREITKKEKRESIERK